VDLTRSCRIGGDSALSSAGYQVHEMIAALAIFSVLFALAAGAVLTIFLLDRAGQRTLVWAAPRTTHVAQAARHAWAVTAEVSMRPLHRPHSQATRTESGKKH
jgi:hypothetical protein